MEKMYPGVAFSPPTVLTRPINETDTVIYVADSSVLPDGENSATIGVDENAETIEYSQKAGGILSGCRRGVEGVAKAWQIDEPIARNWTNKDYKSLLNNIEELDKIKADAKDAFSTYDHEKVGTVHTLTGVGTNIKFKANASFAHGDTWLVNGASVTAKTVDGQGLHTGDIVAGSVVLATVDGGVLWFQIRSYDSQLADFNSQLSNKVSKTGDTMVGDLAISNGHGRFIGGIYNGYGFLKLIAVNGSESTLIQLETGASKVPFVEKSVNGINVSTIPIALAEPPQEFNLPLVSGVTNNYKSTYRKNQFGEVAVIAALSHATALPAVVATLPAGYRPAIDLTFPAVLRNSSGNVAWTVRVGANGQISIRENFGTATSLYFSASFLAAP